MPLSVAVGKSAETIADYVADCRNRFAEPAASAYAPPMPENTNHTLSDVLDRLEESAADDHIIVRDIVDNLGRKSFASLMLIFTLISASPASAIPGVTAIVAAIVFILVVQMIIGRKSVWLPELIMQRRLDAGRLNNGIRWLRKPVQFVEKLLKPRWSFFLRKPWLYLPLVLLLGLTMFMPFMEVVPTSGSIASAVIALFAAALLTQDGLLGMIATALLIAAPAALWQSGLLA